VARSDSIKNICVIIDIFTGAVKVIRPPGAGICHKNCSFFFAKAIFLKTDILIETGSNFMPVGPLGG
jgi:hypothetical protein